MSNVSNIYPLTPLQKGILYHAVVNPNSMQYFEQMEFELCGSICSNIFEQAVNLTIEKYEVLRTAFVYTESSQPKQVVLKSRPIRINYQEINETLNLDSVLSKIKISDRHKLFNLTRDALLRFFLIKIDESKYRLIISFHHIILDGWSVNLLFREIFKFYIRLHDEKKIVVQQNKGYSEYIKWLISQNEDEALEFWSEQLKDIEEPTGFFNGIKKLGETSYFPKCISRNIGKDLTVVIDRVSKELKITPNAIFEAVWGILLSRYNDCENVVFGKIVSGRNVPLNGIDETVGLFINTVPKSIHIESNVKICDLLSRVNKANFSSSGFEFVELNKIQRLTKSKEKVVNHLFVYENYPIDKTFSNGTISNASISIRHIDSFEQTNYDLNVIVSPKDDTEIIFRYNGQIYDSLFLNKLIDLYIHLLHIIENNLNTTIGEFDIIQENEKDRILNSFNHTLSAYPRDKRLIQIIEDNAVQFANHISVVYKEKMITYSGLLETIISRSKKLMNLRVLPGDRVGFLMDNPFELLVNSLAVQKLHASYVPIDTNIPLARKKHIIVDSDIKILLTEDNKNDFNKLVATYTIADVFNVSDATSDIVASYSSIEDNVCDAMQEVCVVYTSGTTAQPKGVCLNSRNISRVVMNTNYVKIVPDDIVLQSANFSFDGSLFNIYGALLNGARLILIDKNTLVNITSLAKVIENTKISVFFITTSLFNALAMINPKSFENLRYLVIGGETASQKYCKIALENIKNGVLINGYGPTEATVFATAYVMRSIKDTSGVISIGTPISNTSVYIVCKSGLLQPIGFKGEICIAGDGVANGYLKDEEMTAKKFVDDNFIHQGKMYKSGDIGKQREDGKIDFYGRKDTLIKIRGYRIDIREIEVTLLKNKNIRNCVVLVKQSNSNSNDIILFYIPNGDYLESDVKDYLKEFLPHYMIPKYAIRMEYFPVNNNGKVDNDTLLAIIEEWSEKTTDNTDVNIGAEELLLLDIWSKILETKKIKVNDDFYEIGGDSIKTITIYSELQRKGYDISLENIIQNPTISLLAKKLRDKPETESADTNAKIKLLNSERKNKLILFPAFLPKFANDIMGKFLIEFVHGYSIFIAAFENSKTLYSEYADELEAIIQENDNILFVGYSFGGNIAYEVAKELENRGIIINSIILIDSYMLQKFWYADLNDLKLEVDKFMDEYIQEDNEKSLSLQEEMFEQMSIYCDFINNYVGIYPKIGSSIYMLLSDEAIDNSDDLRLRWESATIRKFVHLQGVGSHTEMWRGDFMKTNINIMLPVLQELWVD